ncbi:hypothetical protein BGZ63DRAFT_424252 [Mariannaea sp. PMI_226]|nr:hypothetical protein BGZ63DRAFT_424252 [Mariannaea sp. PMI_226]
MPFNIVNLARLCGRKDPMGDRRHAQRTQATTTNEEGDVMTDIPDLESGRHHQDRGLFSLAARAGQDSSYLLGRRFSQQASYCIDNKMIQISRLWEQMQLVEAKDGDTLASLSQCLEDKMLTYLTFLVLVKEVQGWHAPHRQLLQRHLDAARVQLAEDQQSFLDENKFNDWVPAYPIEPLEQWIKYLPQYKFLDKVFRPFVKTSREIDGVKELEYSSRPFQIACLTAFHIIIAALVGVPVAMQALDVTSTTINVVVYMLGLFVLIGFAQVIVPGMSPQFFMTLAYAAVVASNMGHG